MDLNNVPTYVNYGEKLFDFSILETVASSQRFCMVAGLMNGYLPKRCICDSDA